MVWRHGDGAMEVAPWRGRHGVGAIEMAPWRWRHGGGAMAWAPWSGRHGEGDTKANVMTGGGDVWRRVKE